MWIRKREMGRKIRWKWDGRQSEQMLSIFPLDSMTSVPSENWFKRFDSMACILYKKKLKIYTVEFKIAHIWKCVNSTKN